MSTVSEEDERRKRSLEAGKDLLEKYKIARSSKAQGMHYTQTDEQSDEESYHNDKSIDQRRSFMNDVMSSRDVTQSSVSMSEGEADRDLEGMAGHVAELEELLQGKEAIVAALNAEIDHLRGETSSPNSSQSHNSSIPSRDVICLYRTKLQEFEKAINQRDNLIEDLTSSLEQALSARDALVVQLNSMNATRETSPRAVHNTNLQEKIDTLETTSTNQKLVINKLNSQLAQIHKHVQTLEMEKETRNAEISDYKMQINNLNEQIRLGAAEKNLNIAEMLEQQKQYEARVDKIKQDMQHILEKFTAETNTNTARHQQELKELGTKHENELKNVCLKYEEHLQSLKEENKSLADRLNKELPDLESRHAKELSVFQAQLAYYKKTVETLKLELMNHSEAQNRAQAEANMYKTKLEEFQVQAENARRMQELNNQKEKELLNEQIELHKIQLDEITSKYVAATTVLESKESIERSLEQALVSADTLKQENDGLKFKLDDLSSRYSAAQSLIENNQAHERTMSSRIYDLEKSLSRLSGINVSMLSEFNETTYQTFDEVNIKYQLSRQKLEEKEELEKALIDKIKDLEENSSKMKEELEQTILTNKSYEKQLKDTKNMCDKLEFEIKSLRESNSTKCASPESANSNSTNINASEENESAEMLKKVELYKNEIKDLREILKQKNDEIAEYAEKLNDLAEKMKKSEGECQQLKTGLATAWAQCAEVEEKLNQTLAINESTIDVSLPLSEYCAALPKHFRLNKTYCDFTNDSLNSVNDNSNADDKQHDVSSNEEIKSLRNEIASVTKENESLFKEMEHLLEKQTNYDEVSNKLHHYSMLCEKLESEKQSLLDENRKLKADWEEINVLRKKMDDLQAERKKLQKEVENLIEQHKHEISAIKADCTAEIKAMQTLLLNVKEGNVGLNELKTELEARHAKEMEELRTYFEQKCLQMEKQYSEEIFSQQSKKMSDNDSEIEELTEDLYFGGGGDCLNVGNSSGHHSRSGTPIATKETKPKGSNDDISHIEIEYETSIKMLQQQLDTKTEEVENLKLYYEKLLEDLKETYENQLKYAKENTSHLLLIKSIDQYCQTEFDTRTLENGELSKLQAAYNHQLEEQVALARLDIVNALQEQIQALLLVETDGDDNWPPELLVLRDKLTDNAKQQIQEMKETHAAEVYRLKEEYSHNLAQLVESHKEEINNIKAEMKKQSSEKKLSVDNPEFSVKTGVKERDHLQKVCLTLKDLIGELIKYFVVCEEEVNNTLLNEVLKKKVPSSEIEEDISTTEVENLTKTETNLVDTLNSSEAKIRRVHFAPQSNEIISIINSDNDTLKNIIVHNEDILENLRSELNNSLRRLRLESAEIFNNSFSPKEKLDVSKDSWNKNIIEELTMKLNHTEGLILNYQEETEQLKMNILELQRKLISAEGKKEIISEGYGEHDETRNDITLQDFSQLQEKARHVLSNGGGEGSYLMQLIEELCTQSDKLMEDARKEKEDLQQQVPLEPTSPTYIPKVYYGKIEAADKQLRATRTFLEEQAAEREAERDEAAKQINYLQEQIKEREREKERDQRITSENSLSPEPSTEIPVLRVIDIAKTVEALESQMREMSSLMSDTEAKKSETETELKAAVDKIWVLRDIVTDLEQQLQSKIEREESLQLQISQLEAIITAQTKNQQDLVQELDSIKMGEANRQMNEHITHLQEELRKHKLSSEHFEANSSALKQMKVELRDLQLQLDKRIKNLEFLHISDSTLSISQSQPSEDVSIRDQIDATRCPTPDDPTAPPILPLDEILKLKEKMLKHARVEEAAFKKIKDLEMELTALKNQNEELQAEQEILQQTASEQLYQMEAMRGRLEQQKQSAPFAQRQATSRLELELHEANTKIQALEQAISDKELELNDVKDQLQRSNQLLLDKEAEIANVVQLESMTIQKLKDRLSVVEEEKKNLQSKVGIQEQTQLELPQLIDSMLADKNEEIDHLKEQLSKKEKQLEMYSSVALDESQLRELTKHVEAKDSARTLSDILSIHSECEDISEAIRCGPSLLQTIPHNISSFKITSNSPPSRDPLDASIIPLADMNKISMQVPPLDLGSHSQSTYHQNQHVTVDIDLSHNDSELKISSPDNNVVEMTNKSWVEAKEILQSPVEIEISENNLLQASNKRTTNVDNSQDTFKSYHESVRNSKELDNEAVQLQIQYLEKELNDIKEELNTKSAILDKRESELVTLRKQFDELQLELKETCETQTRDKCFYKNQYELMQASENKIRKDLLEVENTLKLKTDELQDMKGKLTMNEKIMIELNSENNKLKETIQSEKEEVAAKYVALVQEKMQELHNLKEILSQKEITIETIHTRNIEIENENKQLYEYKKKYDICEKELANCHIEIQRLTDGLNNRDQIIRRLEEMARRSSLSGASSPSDCKDQEIHHLQEYLKEKDKVIRQMSDDSKSLHRALETIQNKMKESGNVVELRKKLKEEYKMNAELRATLERLTKELELLRECSARRSQDDTDIEDMVQRELNLSARLDKQIMSAIDSDSEELVSKEIERESLLQCSSPPNKRTEEDQWEVLVRKCAKLNLRLKHADKVNEELLRLKDELEIEKEMLKCQVAEYENRIFQIKADLMEESKKVTELDKKLSNDKNLLRSLRLEAEKNEQVMQLARIQDNEFIQYLQEKLKSSLEIEEKLRNEISSMRQEHKDLEIQLSGMKERIESQKSEESSGLVELLQNEQKKYIDLVEEYEKEQRNNAELKDSMKKIEIEKNRYEKQLEVAMEEKESLVSSLVLVEGIKEQLETDLRRTKEELKTKEDECEWLQKRIQMMSDAETKRQDQRSNEHQEIKGLRRELENTREVILDLEADMKQLRQELKESMERESKLRQKLDSLKSREVELTEKLSVSIDGERKQRKLVTELQQKLKTCVKRVLDHKKEVERFMKENDDPTKYSQKIKELMDINDKHASEKDVLHFKLAKAKQDKEQLKQQIKELQTHLQQNKYSLPTNSGQLENVDKAQHIYGKYLQANSKRKSLIYQKRYLLCVIGSYEISQENTLAVLAQLTDKERPYVRRDHHRKRGKLWFKSIVIVIVSIRRMKWMILRRRVGRRVGANALLENGNPLLAPPLRFISQNHSPPVKEKSIHENDAAGVSGLALETYYQRLKNIQQTLGLAMVEPRTVDDISSE